MYTDLKREKLQEIRTICIDNASQAIDQRADYDCAFSSHLVNVLDTLEEYGYQRHWREIAVYEYTTAFRELGGEF